MICTCFGRSFDLSRITRRLAETADLMVGVPDYESYVAHTMQLHPESPPMSRDAFFLNRQAARYATTGNFRCC